MSAKTKLTPQQLNAVTYAVEVLCDMPLSETMGAIRALCALDKRVIKTIPDRHHGVLEFIGVKKPSLTPQNN